MSIFIKKKFIGDDEVDGAKVLVLNNQAIRAKNAAGSAVELFKLDSSDVLQFVQMPQVSADPTSANDIARKSYIDAKDAAEAAARAAAVSSLEAAVDAEEARALSAEAALQSSISSEASARQAADAAEEAARVAADAAEAAARAAADDALDARLDIVEPKVAVVEKNLSTEQGVIYENTAAVYADGQPGIQDSAYRDGWYFKNASAGQKINWYFYDGQAENVSLGAMESVYAVSTLDSLSSLPIMAIYTTPTGSGDAQSWYKSRKVFSAPSQGLVAGKKYVFYVGQAPAVHPELQKVQMVESSSSEGPRNSAERVLTMALNSNSGAAVNNVQMLVESLGFESPAIRRELKLRIRKASVAELAAEAAARAAADSAESAARAAADSAEASARAAADASEASARQAADSAEAAARAAADSAESAARAAADAALQAEIDAEETARASAVSAEAAAREAADSALQAQIDNIISNVDPAALDSLTEIVAAFQSADGDLTSAITALGTSSASALAAETSARQAADAALQSDIDAEEAARIAADAAEAAARAAADSAEAAAREASDGALDARLDVIEGSGEGSIAYAVATEAAARAAADSAEAAARAAADSAEAAARAAADSAEVTARQNADIALQSAIDAEAAARAAADALLANKTLSNLDATTAINSNLLPDTSGSRFLGSALLNWNNIYSRNLQIHNTAGSAAVNLTPSTSSPSGQGAVAALYQQSAIAGPFCVFTGNQSAASTASKALRFETGNATGTTSNSGDIFLQSGTATGTRGKVILSGSTIEPQASVVPNVNGTLNFGSSSLAWGTAYVRSFQSIADTTFIASNGTNYGGGTGTLVGRYTAAPDSLTSPALYSLSDIAVLTGNLGGSGASNKVRIMTGNTVDGASGEILIRTGVPTNPSATRGKVNIQASSVDVNSIKIVNLADGTASADAVNKGQLDAEASARAAADSAEAAARAAADSVESAARAAADSAEAAAREAADSAEQSARISADNALDARLDALELDSVTKSYVDSQDDAVEAAAEAYTDAAISALKGSVSVSYNTLKKIEDKIEFIVQNTDPAALDSLAEIVTAFQGADSNINTAINNLAASASADLDAEEAARIAADSAEAAARAAADSAEASARQAADAAEATARQNADDALDARLDALEADPTTKSYVDAQIASEAAARIAGDGVLQAEVDALEASLAAFQPAAPEVFTLSSGDIANQYVELVVSAVVANSVEVRVNRMFALPSEFVQSVGTAGKVRLSFAGALATGGQQALVAGDTLVVRYWVK